jgi:serine/threonine protein phosphatase 1
MNAIAPISTTLVQIETSDWQDLPVAADRAMLIVGDVHGMYDQYAALVDHARILTATDERFRGGAIVHLGDLVDRGSRSMGCLDLAQRGLGRTDIAEILLLGNHEQMLRLALYHPEEGIRRYVLRLWLRNGGTSVLTELGLQWDAAPEQIRDAIGPARRRFLETARTFFVSGGVTCVHAGINPRADPDAFLAQSLTDWPNDDRDSPFWIRDEFLRHDGPLPGGRFIIHGHTIEEYGPVLRDIRLGIDVGSFRTGRVAMIEVHGNQFRSHIATVDA